MDGRMALAAGVALAVGLAAGCDSAVPGAGGGGTVRTANNGGFVALSSTTAGSTATAAFYKTSTPDTGVTVFYGDGHCAAAGAPVFPTTTLGDAGASITFSNGSRSLVATRFSSFYIYVSSTALGPAATWTMTAAGGVDIHAGAFGSIRVPNPLRGVGIPTVSAGTAATVTWTPAGSDGVSVALGNWTCYAPDTGSFTIPANVTTSAGTGAAVALSAVDYGTVTSFGSRQVLLTGVSQ